MGGAVPVRTQLSELGGSTEQAIPPMDKSLKQTIWVQVSLLEVTVVLHKIKSGRGQAEHGEDREVLILSTLTVAEREQ